MSLLRLRLVSLNNKNSDFLTITLMFVTILSFVLSSMKWIVPSWLYICSVLNVSLCSFCGTINFTLPLCVCQDVLYSNCQWWNELLLFGDFQPDRMIFSCITSTHLHVSTIAQQEFHGFVWNFVWRISNWIHLLSWFLLNLKVHSPPIVAAAALYILYQEDPVF